VTSKQVLENLDVIERKFPELRYVQIDDGYQPAMGDWLDTGPAFGGGIRDVLAKIRAKGFEPAIWVLPYAVNPNRDLNEEVLMRQAFMAIVSVA
jgi:alpha-galactosidase